LLLKQWWCLTTSVAMNMFENDCGNVYVWQWVWQWICLTMSVAMNMFDNEYVWQWM
jgi:hypothetical protein